MSSLTSPASLDELEAAIVASDKPRASCPVTHRFTPGLYIREIFMPAGTLLTTMTHLAEHPFIISRGRCEVFSETDGAHIYQAPHTGITLPGTRRAILVLEDTIWTTIHPNPTDERDVGKLMSPLTFHHNPLLPDNHPSLEAWRTAPALEEITNHESSNH